MTLGSQTLLLIKVNAGARDQIRQLAYELGVQLKIYHPRNHPSQGFSNLPQTPVRSLPFQTKPALNYFILDTSL